MILRSHSASGYQIFKMQYPSPPQTPSSKAYWPLTPPRSTKESPALDRSYNLTLLREILTHMEIMDRCFIMRCTPKFRTLARDTPIRLLRADAFMEHLATLDDDVLRKRVTNMSERLVRAARGVKSKGSRKVSSDALTFVQQIRPLIEQTVSPDLMLDYVVALTPNWMDVYDRDLEDLLLAIALRVWSSGVKTRPTRLRCVPSVAIKRMHRQYHLSSYWQSRRSNRPTRALQFLIEMESTATLQMLVAKCTAHILPPELSDQIFRLLLAPQRLVHPRDVLRVWQSWPANRRCDRIRWDDDGNQVSECSGHITCPVKLHVYWDMLEHRFVYWHAGCFAQSEMHKACREGRCKPHHTMCMGENHDCQECNERRRKLAQDQAET